MTKKIVKFILAPTLVLFFLVFILEAGFGARAKLESLRVPKTDSNKIQILLIGDSILGFLNEPHSITSQLRNNLDKVAPDQFQIQEISSPALRTSVALDKAKELLRSNRTDIAVLMVGKSDYIQKAAPRLTPLSRFRTFRLLEAAYWDLNRRWLALSNPNLKNLVAQAQVAWDLKANHRFEEAIPIFERVLKDGYDHSRVIRALHEGYLKTQQYDRAIAFFEKYKITSAHNNLIESYMPVFKSLSLGQKAGALVAPIEIPNKPQSRDEFRTSLWLSRQNNDAEKFAEIYKQSNIHLSDTLQATSRNNILDLVALLKANGTTVLLLQYPIDDVSALTQILPGKQEHLQIIDTHAILAKAPPEVLMNSWAEDLEHVNEIGARLISEELVNLILNVKRTLDDSN